MPHEYLRRSEPTTPSHDPEPKSGTQGLLRTMSYGQGMSSLVPPKSHEPVKEPVQMKKTIKVNAERHQANKEGMKRLGPAPIPQDQASATVENRPDPSPQLREEVSQFRRELVSFSRKLPEFDNSSLQELAAAPGLPFETAKKISDGEFRRRALELLNAIKEGLEQIARIGVVPVDQEFLDRDDEFKQVTRDQGKIDRSRMKVANSKGVGRAFNLLKLRITDSVVSSRYRKEGGASRALHARLEGRERARFFYSLRIKETARQHFVKTEQAWRDMWSYAKLFDNTRSGVAPDGDELKIMTDSIYNLLQDVSAKK